LTLTYNTGLLGTAPSQYLDAVNVGTRTLVSTTYLVALSVSGIALLGNTTLTLTACSVAWTQSGGGSCSGTATTIKAFQGASSSIDSTVAPLAASSRLHIQAAVSNVGLSLGAVVTAVINTNVAASDFSTVLTNE
jgi:hypothetical protein